MNHAMDRICDVADTWATIVRLADDTQWVMAMRLMGLSGAWSMPNDEGRAMVQEKLPAFTEAAVAGTLAAMSGSSADRVVREALEPISTKASANRERLEGHGLRTFGRGDFGPDQI